MLDPYAALQLHPKASRDLVTEAYWALAGKEQRRLRTAPEATQRIAELNAAYALLVKADLRADYDREHGLDELPAAGVRVINRGFPMLLGVGTITAISDHNDFYHLLGIARDADPAVVDAAFAVLSRQPNGHDVESALLHDLLAEAHQTLGDPARRAEYDATLGAKVSRTAPAAADRFGSKSNESDHGILTAVALDARDMVRFLRKPRRFRPTPADTSNGEGNNGSPLQEQHLAPVLAWGTASATALTTDVLPKATSNGAGRGPVSTGVKESSHNGSGHGAPAGLTRSKRPPKVSQEDRVIEAEHARLMTLRDLDGPSPVQKPLLNGTDVKSDSRQESAVAQLAFLDGPRAGDRVELGDDAVTIGSSYSSDVVLPGGDEHTQPEHARIWLHGDHFILRQLDGETTVAGVPLTLPMVMLDDGDEITIGPHVFRFTVTPKT